MGTQVANINKDQTARSRCSTRRSAPNTRRVRSPSRPSGRAAPPTTTVRYTSMAASRLWIPRTRSPGATAARNLVTAPYIRAARSGARFSFPAPASNRKRDKLFFYIAPEGMNQVPERITYAYFVPTAEMLQGNFSPAYLSSLGAGFASAHAGDALQPTLHGSAVAYPGGIIPRSLLDPTSLAYAKTFWELPRISIAPATIVTTYRTSP